MKIGNLVCSKSLVFTIVWSFAWGWKSSPWRFSSFSSCSCEFTVLTNRQQFFFKAKFSTKTIHSTQALWWPMQHCHFLHKCTNLFEVTNQKDPLCWLGTTKIQQSTETSYHQTASYITGIVNESQWKWYSAQVTPYHLLISFFDFK